MKQILLWIFLFLLSAAHGAALPAAAPGLPELKPKPEQSQAAHLAAELLARFHYKAAPLNDELSARIFDQYLKALDPEKLFFVQADIDRMTGARNRLGDAILGENLAVPFAMFNLFARRMVERFSHARALLADGFDFDLKESYEVARDKNSWPKSDVESGELWRKRVKNDWLRLKLAGKSDQSIVQTLEKRYDNVLKRIGQTTSQDAFQIFMNAYTMAIEPHTNYLGLQAAEEFEISMRLSLVGIGAVLAEKDDYITIREMTPGGPAAISGQLNIGDRIVGIAQGDGGVWTDVVGWRMEDSIALIRGVADSVVMLEVLPADASLDGKRKRVSVTRNKISLEAQAATKSVLTVRDGLVSRRVGVIMLPSFYEDFESRQQGRLDFKSATRDVARLLGELKKEKVDGVLIDLRGNGGGALMEAIELTGLFIDKGPVVQQRDAGGAIMVGNDTDAGVAWDGPLGVLINRGSASASEIFAAAIQDYGRGLIIGEPSFGKGTVQSMVNLDQVAENDKPRFGELKMTIAQFFRINGSTTQLRGVTPDILFPAMIDLENLGESGFSNALPWVQIKPADYVPVGDLKAVVPMLVTRHEARVKKDRDFQYLLEDVAQYQLERERNRVSLNETERRQERARWDARLASRDTRTDAGESVTVQGAEARSIAAGNKAPEDDGLQASERNLANDLVAEKARKQANDVLLNEAVHIMSDEVGILRANVALAARVKPGTLSIAD